MQKINLEHRGLQFEGIFFNKDAAKGHILVCPAMGVTAKYYHNLATWLNEQGFAVMVIDYLGTGNSENLIKQAITFKDWIKNIEIAGKWLKDNNPTIPLIFVGHSIGSQLFGFVEEILLFDKAVFLASSTGYWKDGHSPQKWINYFLLNIVLPISNLIWGYTNAKFFKQGENYPKLPSLQWRKWCTNKEYLKIDLNDTDTNNYNNYKGKITSIWFSDDPVANEISAPRLVSIYKNALINLVNIKPSDMGQQKIGHTGFLSRKFSETLWPTILDNIKIEEE